MKDIRHLFFDLDDTLWDFKKNSGAVLSELFHEHNLDQKLNTDLSTFIEKYRAINYQLWSRFYTREIDKSYMRDQRFHLVFQQFGYDDHPLNLQISNAYMQRAPHGTALKSGCLETLNYLKTKYQLHIITNGFSETQSIKIDGSGLRHFFSNIIVSEEHQLVKPETEIFRIAERLAGALPNECVMIGDSLESDIFGALNAGWKAIYLKGENEKQYTGQAIHELEELLQIF